MGIIRHIVQILLLNRLRNNLLVIIAFVLLLALVALGLVPSGLIVRIGCLMGFGNLQIRIVIVVVIVLVRVVSALGSPSPRFLLLQLIKRSQVSRVVMRVIVRQLDLSVRDNYSFFHNWFLIEKCFLIFIHRATIPDGCDGKDHK